MGIFLFSSLNITKITHFILLTNNLDILVLIFVDCLFLKNWTMSFLLCALLCSNLEFYPEYYKCSVMETLHSIIVPEELILTLCLFVFKSGASFG